MGFLFASVAGIAAGAVATGAVSSIFGGGTSTAVSTPSPASAEERALQAEALVTAQIRNQLLREQIEAQAATFARLGVTLETGIAGTLEEEARFGILAGETIGPGAVDVDTGADIQTFLAEPPPSSQIGAPGTAVVPVADTAAISRVQSQLREARALLSDARAGIGGDESPDIIGNEAIVSRLEAELKSLTDVSAEAQQASAIQTAVQEALAEQGATGAVERLKQSVLQLSAADAKTPAGEGIRQQLLQKQLDLIERGGRATPEDIEDIKRAADAASEEGAISIRHFADRLLIDIRDVLTPARGLRPQDTPIRDVGGRVGAEATKQFGELQARLRTVQAEQELTLPLARQGFQAGLLSFQQNLTQAAREFQVGLRQQAFENRLRLATASSAAFGSLLGTPSATVNFPRGTTTATQQPGNVLGGIGGLLTGVGAVFGRGGIF